MLPFLVDMDRLFELFVVEWLKQHAPAQYAIVEQENVTFSMRDVEDVEVKINIDITVKDLETGRTAFVLDTKYKAAERPAAADIQQVVAYAAAKDCTKAALVYPVKLGRPVSVMWGSDIYVRSLDYRLDGDLEDAGRNLLEQPHNWSASGA